MDLSIHMIIAATLFITAGVAWSLWKVYTQTTQNFLLHLVKMVRLHSDAVCLIDSRCNITWTNEAYCNLTGYGASELTGQSLENLLHQHVDGSESVAALDAAFKAHKELRIDLAFRYKSGDIRYMVIELHPLHHMIERRFLGFAVILIDIDRHRKEKETTLRALRDRQTLLDILDKHAIVSETDLQGRITRTNERFVQVSGYSSDELIGHTHRMVSSGHHPPQFFDQMWDTITQGNIWHGEVCNRAKDGSLYWVDSVIAPMLDPDGLPAKYVSIRTDITALKRSRDLLEHTSRIAGIGGWTYDPETRNLHCTEEARIILALPNSRIHADDLVPRLLHEPMRTQFPLLVRKTLETAEPLFQEIEIHRPGGRSVWVRVSCEATFQDGRAYRLIGAVQDISDQVQTRLRIETSERILRSAINALGEAFALYDEQDRLVLCNDKYFDLKGGRDKLPPGISFREVLKLSAESGLFGNVGSSSPEDWISEQLQLWKRPHFQLLDKLKSGRWIKSIGAQTPDGMRVLFHFDVTDLQVAREAADAASRSKSQFLANMSHEIRTPMNAVIGLLQLLEQTPLDDDQLGLLRKTERAAFSLLSILNDILDFSKVEAGKMKLAPEPFELDTLLGDLSTILSGSLGEKALELVYDIDPAIPQKLIGDASRIKQILINLGGNAVKFTSQGEVLVRVRLCRLDARGALLEFSVEDTGIGISAESISHIFKGFSQAEASTSRRFGGTGLGLAISKRLVELMGGQLHVDSELGHGSRFFFELLLKPQEAALQADPQVPAIAHQPPMPRTARQEEMILLIEPNASSRQALTHMLKLKGQWQVHACINIASAIQALDNGFAPSIALINVESADIEVLAKRLQAFKSPNSPSPLVLLSMSRKCTPTIPLPVLRKPLTASMVMSEIKRHRQPSKTRPQTSSLRLQDMHLLLVEDNEINQEVAVRLLQREGAVVTVASNGLLGVKALEDAPQRYNLVLMDMQMPVMDGLEATRAIRKIPSHASLPIIAMTANAMQADREACLEAGMNDHVGKPFDINELIAAIHKHTGWNVASTHAAQLPAPRRETAPHTVDKAFTTPVFDPESALHRLGHDIDFYCRLLRDFAPAARFLATRIATASQEQDSMAVRGAAHQLKSTAAATGSAQLSAACATIEKAQHEELPPLVLALDSLLDETLAKHAAWLQQTTHGESQTGANIHDASAPRNDDESGSTASLHLTADLDAELSRLVDALAASDMLALELSDDLLMRHGATLGNAGQQLQAAMDTLDFEAAIQSIKILRTHPASETSAS